jgi:hypothetical protein
MKASKLRRIADKYNQKHYKQLWQEKMENKTTPRERLMTDIESHASYGYYSMLINEEISQEDKDWFIEQGLEIDEFGKSIRRISEGQTRFNWG